MERKKRNYIYTAILLGAGFIALTSLNLHSENVDLLTLENIEAIANGETDSEGRIDCYSSFTNKGDGDSTVKDCGTCMDVKCADYSDKGKCKK
ncbi:hypothetical protein [Phocaeicola massiliensis]|jgi:hypothetical protein|uniref:hypothetical protein n=1 Tax=Phocaeicola massiliensis TaxID=204516 RepID=UPI002030F489|nr:hypothetical protein [Phocaeicola massiliensis]MCM1616511.1 hypothetical protein [Phocaeicola massiliensis]MCM1708158.1 hypothetical protein [Phocaeicola massiliensis]